MDYTPPPNIPPAVVEFAEKRNRYNTDPDVSLWYLVKWKDYDVFYVSKKRCNNTLCGSPIYILNNKYETRFATPYEKTPIYATYRKMKEKP